MVIEKLKKLEKRTRVLRSDVDLVSLIPGDVVNFKNRGVVVCYGRDEKGRMNFYMPSVTPGNVEVWKIKQERIGVLGEGLLCHHMSEADGDEMFIMGDRNSQEYIEMRKDLESIGLMD